jgi:hypothetical protein
MARSQVSDEGPRVCRICGAQLDSHAGTSEVYGGTVCAECARIEHIGFIWCAVGAVVIFLVWAVVQVLYRRGVVGIAVRDLASLRWAAIWFGICLLLIYFRLKKRKKLSNKP